MKEKSYGIANCVTLLKEKQNKQLRDNTVPVDFPENIASLTEKDIIPEYFENRKDFCDLPVMSIDCDSSKDLDDAICVERTHEGFRLSVHIADVSAYIEPCSELEQIALLRGTSYYLPNLTIPMLPRVLSENLCSLNPGVERLTLSVIMWFDYDGKLLRYEVVKGKIRSRVKGVYSEVDLLLNGSKNRNLLHKYREVSGSFPNMVALYKALRAKRIKRGSLPEENGKPIITVTKDNIIVTPRTRGLSENIIEEFMIEANYAVSLFLADNDLPAIFRVQKAEENMASYQPEVTQHKSLRLESYVHFTSPIRRCSDYFVHRIISLYLAGYNSDIIHALYDEELPFICSRATKRSRTANSIQNRCERICYETYFDEHQEKRHSGIIVGFNDRNFPIIKINDYNLNIISFAIVGGNIGDKYSFNVAMGKKCNHLVAFKVKKTTA